MTEFKPLNHTGTVTLETPRLTLRRVAVDDAEHMYNNWAGDDEVTKFLRWDTHPNVDHTRERLALWVKEYEQPDNYNWGMELKENGQLIGTIGAVQMNEGYLSCEIGYCMSRRYWNRGLMSEALGAVLGHMFRVVGMNRVYACHDPNNPGSGRVMAKNGMSCEGTFKQAVYLKKRGFHDLTYYAILSEDYCQHP